MVSLDDRFIDASWYEAIAEVARTVLESGRGLLWGLTLTKPRALESTAAVAALYCTYPAYFPKELEIWRGSDPATVFVWLVPISQTEAKLAVEHWHNYEADLVANDPNLLDPERDRLR